MRSTRTALQLLGLVLVLLLFFTSIELMGDSFKLMGENVARTLLETTSNPFVGLFIGILATSLVQSSSTVTTMTVTLVAGGGLTIDGAIPIVMGANIGTSVTNTIVSLGSVTRKDEFGRAMAGATVHDFFNLLAVAVLFPIELATKAISTIAAALTDGLAGIGGADLLSPVKVLIEPVAGFIVDLTQENGIAVLIIGLLLLFISLRYLVTLLKGLVLGRSEKLLHKYIFGAPAVSMLFGVLLTILVQSSSITTSLMVPLVAAGLVTVAQIFPFVLGANIGTTITALLAALVAASGADGTVTPLGVAALTTAFAHMSFNVLGIALFFPIQRLRNIPIRLSQKLGELAVRNRGYAFGYVLTVFFVLPLITILVTRNLDFEYNPPEPDVLEEMAPVDADSDTSAIPPLQIDTSTVQDTTLQRPDGVSDR
jgi:sodium-dependent phosphate cotransporter